ncbi:MAG TPA: hypothetical protein VIJ35_03185, partial [Bradyrhizobium sp.]
MATNLQRFTLKIVVLSSFHGLNRAVAVLVQRSALTISTGVVLLPSMNTLYTPCDCRVMTFDGDRGAFPGPFTCSWEMLPVVATVAAVEAVP